MTMVASATETNTKRLKASDGASIPVDSNTSQAHVLDEEQIEHLKLKQEDLALSLQIRQIKDEILKQKQLLRCLKKANGTYVPNSDNKNSLERNDNCGNSDKPVQLTERKARLKARRLAKKTAIAKANGELNRSSKSVKYCTEQFKPPPFSVPICANVLEFDFKALGEATQFDVIMMDPPWQLATAAPTRGVALGYHQLCDKSIMDMNVKCLSSNGWLFLWVINNRFDVGLQMMENWGYKYVDSLDWVKQTKNRRLAKSHGYYLQHGKETCLVGFKGEKKHNYNNEIVTDIIFAKRRGQSQKPEEIYHTIEKLVPNGNFLEIFARRNNLHDYWVSIGNEL